MTATRIATDQRSYEAVLGELHPHVVLSARVPGAVVALDGAAGWAGRLRNAAAEGALAAVVSEPSADDAGGGPFDDLRLAVVLERRWLRPDVAHDALAARAGSVIRAIVVECLATAEHRARLACDAIGWARVFAGGPLHLLAHESTGSATVALLEGPADVPVTLSISTVPPSAAGGLIRVTALGETRTEVTVDASARRTEIETVTEQGTSLSAQRFESPERLALRRAVEAVSRDDGAVGAGRADLADWVHDHTIAARIRST